MIVSYSGNAHGEILMNYNLLQNINLKINVTIEHSSKELLFLDIFIKNVNGRILTNTYHKPTDTQQYHNFNTPLTNCIKSIPYTLARRIYFIIMDKILRKTRLKELHTTLHQRGYPTTLIKALN